MNNLEDLNVEHRTLDPVITPPVVPAQNFQIMDVLDRDDHGPPEFAAPSARVCIVVQPSVLTESYVGLFATGWKPVDDLDIYELNVGDTLLYIGRDKGRVWTIEATFPITRQPPVVLGLGCSVIVTRSPMAAAQIARACTPNPVAPFQWISYW